MRKWTKPFWLAIAFVFLFEAWVWDGCVLLGRRLLSLLPWERIKAAIAGAVKPLPPPAALLIFLIPLAIIEPFKIVSLWLIASGHWVLGILGFVAAKFVGFGIIAFLFDLTRDKLLSMKWMASLYDVMIRCRDWAHELVEPYRQQIRRQLDALQSYFHQKRFGDSRSWLGKLQRLRRRYRRPPPTA